jgi:HEAT repeat protein
MTLVAVLLMALQGNAQAGAAPGLLQETKEECKKALDAFRAAFHTGGEAGRSSAVEALGKHHCPNAIAALAPIAAGDSDKVRIAAAHALGGIDHPKSVEALMEALSAAEGAKDVFDAVLKAIQTLDWEPAAERLNSMLSKYHDKGLIDEVQAVIPVLGSLGSPTSVDPLLTLLEHAEQAKPQGRGRTRASGNPKLAALEGPIKAALVSITGGTGGNYKQWKAWWQENRDRLSAQAVLVFWCKLTGKRFEQKASDPQSCPYHDKPEKDGVIVKVRLRARA